MKFTDKILTFIDFLKCSWRFRSTLTRRVRLLGRLRVLCQLAACYFRMYGLSAVEYPVFSELCTIVYTLCTAREHKLRRSVFDCRCYMKSSWFMNVVNCYVLSNGTLFIIIIIIIIIMFVKG